MNELREAIEAYLSGRSDLASVERALYLSLAREPHLGAAHGAYIEALYRANRISGEAYLALVKITRSGTETDRTRFRTPGAPSAPSGPSDPGAPSDPAAPASSVPEGDKTILRAPKSAGGTGAAPAAPPAEAGEEKTRFRMPAAPAGAPPAAPAPAADATRLRARPVAGASAAPAPSREAVPAGTDPSWSPTTGSQSGPVTGSSTGSFTGGTGPSTWSDPNRWSGAASAPLAVGSVIKERFVLEDELGRGGMGIVFKARDLRMEEAQDRNPYVALKILNDEFKRHPESLKALQREFRKAQSLAHPNVVTVGDFDRDGGNVFMTMELLEGEPLDRIIKRASTGVEKKKALRIIRDICRAMAYAHERGIVHSDFKPANAFLTSDGVVKVFDFGIARAAKTGDKASGTVTVFDAGTLGALTPAYASCEMLDGAEPDVRDDVYAIACVAYELLTGKHPFDRKSAVQARTAGLVPARPSGLNRSQWRALKRGLAFRRERRSASAIELLNGLLPPKRSPAVYVGAGAAVLAVVVVAIILVPREIQSYRQQRWLAALRSGTAARIETVLPALDGLTPTARDAIFADRDARDGLIRYYNGKIRGAESSGDYFIAGGLANKLIGYLPDYADAQRISQQVTSDSNDALERQSNRFDADLAAGRLIPAQGADNIEAVLAAVRRINPKVALLHDPRLPGAFAAQARLALEGSNMTLAQQLVTSGLAMAPTNPTLGDLRDRVRATLLAQQTAARVGQLETSLAALIATRPALGALDARRADMTELRTDAPASAVLARVQQYAQGELGREVGGLVQQHQYPQAQSLLDEYADLASAAFIERQREALSAAQLTAEHKAADEAHVREQRIADLKARLAALLGRGPGDNPAGWDAQLSEQQGALSAYLAPSDPYFAQVRAAAAAAYLKQADALRQADRLSDAGQMLAHAQSYGLAPAELARESQLLAASRTQLAAAAQAQEQQAQTEALEQKLLVQADANTVNDALASLTALRARLPASDPFLTTQAPAAIGRGYLRLAASAALDGRFEEAQSLVAKGQATVPSFAALGEASQRYASYVQLDRDMASVDAANVDRVRAEIGQAARTAPREARALEHALVRSFAVRIGAAPDAAAANRLMTLGHRLFPSEAQFVPARAPAKPVVVARQSAPAAAPSTATSAPVAAPAAATSPLVARTTVPRQPETVAPAPAAPVSLHNCANPELVGAGGNPRASCWDEIGGRPGPLLVVVPAPPGGQPFAIGRYTVSNADFARYCRATGKCSPAGASPALPVTSISIQAAQGYLRWLSRESGAVYRLPSAAEYVYAAEAGSSGGEQLDANCEKSGLAASLLPVNSGDPNAWGLYNFDGNVQQWVRSGSELEARGGDYQDGFSQCKPSTARPQSGAPSAVTGFRVLREIK
jgi:Protein kinase domain/Sulfatase-modifying factor enzyme 1